ncbi:MAG TPA: YitT family protein [Candidatus Ornithoclostridium faecavium]|nr:YitT family protein [Candidatus Ornithoclostridium faecavium]
MKKLDPLGLLRNLRYTNFIFLTLAGVINAVGVTLMLAPAGMYDGGFSGTSILLSQVTPLSMSVFLLLLNVPFFLFGLKKLGGAFIVYSLYTVAIYSLFSYLFQNSFGIDFSDGSPIAGTDLLLCSVFGGIISGIGSGITIRFGGAIDGVEVMAVVFAKKIGMTVGSFVMSYNVILYVIAGIVTKGWVAPLYSVIAYTVGLKAVDFIIDGFDKAKSAFIITDRHGEVADALTEEFGRGVTSIDATGHYSQSSKTVLYCVVNRFEVGKLKSIVTNIDSSAFLVINDVTDTLGSSLKYERFIKRSIKKSAIFGNKKDRAYSEEIAAATDENAHAIEKAEIPASGETAVNDEPSLEKENIGAVSTATSEGSVKATTTLSADITEKNGETPKNA